MNSSLCITGGLPGQKPIGRATIDCEQVQLQCIQHHTAYHTKTCCASISWLLDPKNPTLYFRSTHRSCEPPPRLPLPLGAEPFVELADVLAEVYGDPVHEALMPDLTPPATWLGPARTRTGGRAEPCRAVPTGLRS